MSEKNDSKVIETNRHTVVYDIIDEATLINQEMYRLADHIDVLGEVPNSLQGMLGKICRYEGKTQAEISQIYNIDMKNTIKYVSELYKRGYVEKIEKKNRKEIYLTAEGKRVNDHFMHERAILLNQVLKRIPEASLLGARQVLSQLSELLKEYNESFRE